jgi:hypothetical protein
MWSGEKIMQGEKVIVRAFKGEPLVRLIWEVFPDAISICDQEGYQKLLAGEPWMPIGFPRKDVFRYDAAVVEKLMSAWQVDPSIWDSLSLWTDDDEAKEEHQ